MLFLKNKISLAQISSPFGDNDVPKEEIPQQPREKFPIKRETEHALINRLLLNETNNLKIPKRIKLDLTGLMKESSFELLYAIIFKLTSLEFFELEIDNNSITDFLSLNISNINQVSFLQLHANSCYFNDNGISRIAQGISKLHKISILLLNLRDSKIANIDSETLLSAIQSLPPYIEVLVVMIDFSLIRKKGIEALAKSFSYLQRIVNLVLCTSKQEAEERKIEVLTKSISSLINLRHLWWDFIFTELTSLESALVFSSVSLLTNLQELHLSVKFIEINKTYILSLTKSFRLFKQLLVLYLQFYHSDFNKLFSAAVKNSCRKNAMKLVKLNFNS